MKSVSLLSLSILLSVCTSSLALEAGDEKLGRAIGLMKNDQWALAHAVFSEIDESEQKRGVGSAAYGKVLFSMGLCQMELARASAQEERKQHYEQALVDFSKCRALAGEPGDENRFVRRALLRMAMCSQALEDFDKAFTDYGQFLLERNQIEDSYDHGSLLLNLAICSARKSTPDFQLASKYLHDVVKNLEAYQVSKLSVAMTYIDVYGAGIDDATDAAVGLGKLGGEVFSLLDAKDLSVVFTKIVGLAHEGKEDARYALRMLDLLPWVDSGRPVNAVGVDKSLVIASVELLGSVSSANSALLAWQYLLKNFSDSDRTELWLYRSIVAAVETEGSVSVQALVENYLTTYPQGENRDAVRLLQLSTLFDHREYAAARELAMTLLAEPSLGKSIHEAASYILVGTSFYSGAYEEVLAEARQYDLLFSEGKYAEAVLYFKGVSLAQIGYKSEAKAALSAVLDLAGTMHDLATYELARLAFDLAEYEQCVERLEGLLSTLETSDSRFQSATALRARVLMLLAECQSILRQREQAEVNYLRALELARGSKFAELEQEILFYLIEFYGRENVGGQPNPEMGKCLPYYDAFFETFSESAYAAQIAAAAMPALVEAGQAERGLARLESVLRVMCEAPLEKEAGMREAASALVWGRLDAGQKPHQLKKMLSSSGRGVYSAVLWHALIEVYQAGARQASARWGVQMRYEMFVHAMFAQQSQNSEEMILPAYIEKALGEWLLRGGCSPSVALTHFKKAQNSSLTTIRQWARLGEVSAHRLLASEVELANAGRLVDELRGRVLGDAKFEEALANESIELHAARGEHDAVIAEARAYLTTKKMDLRRGRIWFLLAKSYDESGKRGDAIANYSRVFAGYTRVLPVSAPTVDRLCAITWQRNRPASGSEPSDKQVAYQLAHRYLGMVKDYPLWERRREGVKIHLEVLTESVKKWEFSGEVVTVKELLKQRYKLKPVQQK